MQVFRLQHIGLPNQGRCIHDTKSQMQLLLSHYMSFSWQLVVYTGGISSNVCIDALQVALGIPLFVREPTLARRLLRKDLYMRSRQPTRLFIHPAVIHGRIFRREGCTAEFAAAMPFLQGTDKAGHQTGKTAQSGSPSLRLHPRIKQSGVGRMASSLPSPSSVKGPRPF